MSNTSHSSFDSPEPLSSINHDIFESNFSCFMRIAFGHVNGDILLASDEAEILASIETGDKLFLPFIRNSDSHVFASTRNAGLVQIYPPHLDVAPGKATFIVRGEDGTAFEYFAIKEADPETMTRLRESWACFFAGDPPYLRLDFPLPYGPYSLQINNSSSPFCLEEMMQGLWQHDHDYILDK